MIIVGIDLSGPSNTADTAMVVFTGNVHALTQSDYKAGATDADIFNCIKNLPYDQDAFVGLDAPLSYSQEAGDRKSDKELRKRIVECGMHPGSVMAPTSPRMCYLTLRGISVANMITSVGHPSINVLEVHPGAALTLGGADVEDVKQLKSNLAARHRLLHWLESQGLKGLNHQAETVTDHYVAACACALSAWKHANGEPAWEWPSEYPHHLYDFVC